MKRYRTVRAPISDLTDDINTLLEALNSLHHRKPRLFTVFPPPDGSVLYSAIIEYEE